MAIDFEPNNDEPDKELELSDKLQELAGNDPYAILLDDDSQESTQETTQESEHELD